VDFISAMLENERKSQMDVKNSQVRREESTEKMRVIFFHDSVFVEGRRIE
jgi:hypothetical protein